MKNDRPKILIIKIGAIGDVVMALSMLNAIDQKYPGAEISWLCGTIVEPLLKNVPRIDKIICLDEKKLLTGNFFHKLNEIIKTWLKLFLKKYDLAVIAYKNPYYKILALFTFKKRIADFRGTGRLNTVIPGRYYAVEYTKLILGKDDWEAVEIGFPKINIKSTNVILKKLDSLKGKKIVLNPGGAKNLINGGELRRWPVEHYRDITKKLLRHDINIILIGGDQDEWVLEYFNDIDVINLINKTSLMDLLSLFEKCDMLLTHDTGALHLAKLTGIKILGLFGPLNPTQILGTKENVDIIFLGHSLPCSPCYDGKNFADCNNNLCMKNITVDIVYKRIIDKFHNI